MGGVEGSSKPMGPLTLDSSGQAVLTDTMTVTGSGSLSFHTQTQPPLVNQLPINAPDVKFATLPCPQPTPFMGFVTPAKVTAVEIGGACVGHLRLGGELVSSYQTPIVVKYHWLSEGVTSPQQTSMLGPAGRTTVGLAVEPYPHDSGTVQLVIDSPVATSSTPLDYTVSAPIAPSSKPTRPLDPSQPPARATPPPPVPNCS